MADDQIEEDRARILGFMKGVAALAEQFGVSFYFGCGCCGSGVQRGKVTMESNTLYWRDEDGQFHSVPLGEL